jgi:SM-20-related protein
VSSGFSGATWRERRAGDRSIWVSDDMFKPSLVTIVYRVIARLPHYRTDYDTSQSDFRHLKHEWSAEELDDNLLLRAIRDPIVEAVEHFYGEFEPVLSRVHANDQTFGDILVAHTDVKPGGTGIYYANDSWEPAWDGETMFYDGDEAVTAVAPKPGRVAIFPADLVHRSGVPSRVCHTTRRSIAFKFKTARGVP